MITKYKYKSTIPYSLHDMVVNKIIFDEDSINNNNLQFEKGFEQIKEPFKLVKGNITIKKVDFDFVDILILNKNGEYGDFNGKKLTLKEFLNKYDSYSFEIVDELHETYCVEYRGFLTVPNKNDCVEMILSVVYFEDIIYETTE